MFVKQNLRYLCHNRSCQQGAACGQHAQAGQWRLFGQARVILSAEKQLDLDTVRLTQDMEAALNEIAPSLLRGVKATCHRT